MKPGISIQKIQGEQHLDELEIGVCDGLSMFCNRVYIGHREVEKLIRDLETFHGSTHGGLLDVAFGKFGPEYGSGAFRARLHFPSPERMYVATHQQSDFEDFKGRPEASEARFHLQAKPRHLDTFVEAIRRFDGKSNVSAFLKCRASRF